MNHEITGEEREAYDLMLEKICLEREKRQFRG